MPDRCCLFLRTDREGRNTLARELGLPEDAFEALWRPGTDGLPCFSAPEADSTWLDAVERAAKSGAVLVGFHGEGEAFGPGLFAGHGRVFAEAQGAVGSDEGIVVSVRVPRSGPPEIPSAAWREVVRFVEVERAARAALGVPG